MPRSIREFDLPEVSGRFPSVLPGRTDGEGRQGHPRLAAGTSGRICRLQAEPINPGMSGGRSILDVELR